MKLYVDLETLQLIEGPGFRNPVTSLRFKRGDAARLEVAFLANGTTPATIGNPASLELSFGVKPRNRYDVGYLVHTATWTMPAPGATSPVYLCAPSFNTTELDSALQVGSSTGTELSEITLMGEITWREGVGEPTSTRTFIIVVENDVNRGTEGAPTKMPTPEDWLDERAVRYDMVQALSSPQKTQARANIGAQATIPNYATITGLSGYPTAFPPSTHNHPAVVKIAKDLDVYAVLAAEPYTSIYGRLKATSNALIQNMGIPAWSSNGDTSPSYDPEWVCLTPNYGYWELTSYSYGSLVTTLSSDSWNTYPDDVGWSGSTSSFNLDYHVLAADPGTQVGELMTVRHRGYPEWFCWDGTEWVPIAGPEELVTQSGQLTENQRTAVRNSLAVMDLVSDQSVGGQKYFYGQLEAPSQAYYGQDSLLTSRTMLNEQMLLDHYESWDIWTGIGAMSSGGAAGSGYSSGGQALASGVGGWARINICPHLMRPPGTGQNNAYCHVPLAISLVGSFSPGPYSTVRIMVGGSANTGVACIPSDVVPLNGRGFGVEIFFDPNEYANKFQLFCHDGNSFYYGSPQYFTGIWTGQASLVLASNGAGQITLHYAGDDNYALLGKPTLQYGMTLYNGPTDGMYDLDGGVTMECAGDSSWYNSASALGIIMRGKIHLNRIPI